MVYNWSRASFPASSWLLLFLIVRQSHRTRHIVLNARTTTLSMPVYQPVCHTRQTAHNFVNTVPLQDLTISDASACQVLLMICSRTDVESTLSMIRAQYSAQWVGRTCAMNASKGILWTLRIPTPTGATLDVWFPTAKAVSLCPTLTARLAWMGFTLMRTKSVSSVQYKTVSSVQSWDALNA